MDCPDARCSHAERQERRPLDAPQEQRQRRQGGSARQNRHRPVPVPVVGPLSQLGIDLRNSICCIHTKSSPPSQLLSA